MPIKFLGQDTVVTFQDYLNAGALLIGLCRRTTELERIRETIETTTLEGQEVGHVLGLKRGRFSMNALSIFNEIGEQSANDEQLRQWFESGTILYVQVLDAKGDMQRLIDFYAYIERYRIVRNNNEGANVDVDLLWTQPDPYDIPLLACPTVTVTPGLNSILLEFNGVEGTTYTFDMVSPVQTIVVTEPPFEALFTGLTPSTSYTIEVSVDQYGLDQLTCSNIVASTTSTTSATIGIGYGGADVTGACEQTHEVTFYYTGTFGIGTLLYEDAALTIPFNDYAFVKFFGVVYGITAGQVTSSEGSCSGPTGTPYNVGVGNTTGEACVDATESPITVYSPDLTWTVGMMLFTDDVMTIPLTGFNYIAEVGIGNIFNLNNATGELESDTGLVCFL